MSIDADKFTALRAPFAPELIYSKPRGGVMLDYVGHADVTDRLLKVDPEWNWEPLACDEAGLPVFDATGGLWIRLTVCGITRLGYGHADGKKGGDAIKEIIGDALRNASMRFGVALDLWRKADKRTTHTTPSGLAEKLKARATPTPWPDLIEAADTVEALRRLWQRAKGENALDISIGEHTVGARIEERRGELEA